MPKILLFAAALAAAPPVAFAADMAPGAAAPAVVKIHNMRFDPVTLTISAGTKVTWVNEDNSPHTVTDKGKVFRSAALDTRDSFSYTFATPGEFTYFCTLHPIMVGKVIVKPAGRSS